MKPWSGKAKDELGDSAVEAGEFHPSSQDFYHFEPKAYRTFNVLLSDLDTTEPFRFVNKSAGAYSNYKEYVSTLIENARIILFRPKDRFFAVNAEPIDSKAFAQALEHLQPESVEFEARKPDPPFLEGVKLRPLDRIVGVLIAKDLEQQKLKREEHLPAAVKTPLKIRVNVILEPLKHENDRYGYQINDGEFQEYPASVVDPFLTAIAMLEKDEKISEEAIMCHLGNTYFDIRRGIINEKRSPATINKIFIGKLDAEMVGRIWSEFLKTIFDVRGTTHMDIIVNFLKLVARRSFDMKTKEKDTIVFHCLAGLPVRL
ncbi:uncharacterized protein LOC129582749 [Paramacrobiotus metropolitanus]|uniref:uncharacterized protein LOC129582749 n=1 Tax=Paramacrobiotus metropolitanus TaxID=2943436 RepID=UPI0024456E16|nr:uncharacterized protein LOC129582749 [Paramacrobiotus metropolitanus]